MTEITFNKNIYVYGKFYEDEKTNFPKDEDNWDVIIYEQPWNETKRTIGSLEGLFVSEIPFTEKGKESFVEKDWNPIIKRGKMPLFEERYQGKFIPFKK